MLDVAYRKGSPGAGDLDIDELALLRPDGEGTGGMMDDARELDCECARLGDLGGIGIGAAN